MTNKDLVTLTCGIITPLLILRRRIVDVLAFMLTVTMPQERLVTDIKGDAVAVETHI